jgi:hypothetical protein
VFYSLPIALNQALFSLLLLHITPYKPHGIEGRYACTEQMPKDLKFCMDNKTTRERSFFMQTLIKYLKK